jgi:hypothetical protein
LSIYAVDTRLKPQDVLVALKLVASMPGSAWTQPDLARSLHVSASEVNHGLKRLTACHLYNPRERRVVRACLQEFLVSGLRYVFPAKRGGIARGLPTAHAASPLNAHFAKTDAPPPVWPDPEGTVRGEMLEPLYRSAPKAARLDKRLYELLALVDAVRSGRARERELAVKELRSRIR